MSETAAVHECSCPGDKPEPHECPFQADVHDDHEFLCRCCAKCENECRDDI